MGLTVWRALRWREAPADSTCSGLWRLWLGACQMMGLYWRAGPGERLLRVCRSITVCSRSAFFYFFASCLNLVTKTSPPPWVKACQQELEDLNLPSLHLRALLRDRALSPPSFSFFPSLMSEGANNNTDLGFL